MNNPPPKRSKGGDPVRSDQIVMSDWALLPEHLLDSVSERLLLSSDYLRFSAVCTPWFGVAKQNQSQHKSHTQPPMLLFFNAKEDAWSLYHVIENKVIDLLFQLPNRRFCGSSYGWLVLVEQDFAVTLIKPFPKSKDGAGRENLVIRLPQLNPPELIKEQLRRAWLKDRDYYVVKAIITADPILNVEDCIVVVSYLLFSQMAFIRPGKDTTWTYLPAENDGIVDIIQRGDGNFYAVGIQGNLLTFNVTSESNSDVKCWDCGVPSNCSIRKYLVDSNGKDLLMVDRSFSPRKAMIHSATEFKVYKFDFSKCLWIEKETLGDDAALFIGENLSICVEASNFPGCKQNCIYFNHDFDYDFVRLKDMLSDFGVYDMEKKSFSKPYSKHVMDLLQMVNQRPIWFTPITFQL